MSELIELGSIDVSPISKKKNIVLDATMLSTLMACPRLLDMRFNHQLVPMKGKGNSLEVGLIVHKVLEVFYWHMINGSGRVKALIAGMTAGQLYVQGCRGCAGVYEGVTACGHQHDEYPGVVNTPAESTGQKEGNLVGWKWALATCEQYFDFYKNDFWVPLEVEVTKREILYEDDEIRILWKAKLDWIVDTNQGIFPSDHKTSKQRRDTNSQSSQFMGQCILMKTRKTIINKIGFQTTLKPEEKFTRVLMTYSADRLMEWQSEILPHYAYQLLSFSENDSFPPNFTHCESKYGNCVMLHVCEADRGMRGETVALNFIKGPVWDPGGED